ncbi:hypothetical protein IE81DRAFT_72299 [Ceraceosorus guamensis]|uniref:Uncharacterized protein n=1 Tax=Ceraceosorus guamensis TaxID=1522189 RepID=A0A316W100_9BASI|nr:hypothetical protein IE81DRAFT_72299 [Ceraceosorus guamensis]PWN43607.1 hypothetical protein IE81DRAFT_72299 [Ceraceosorus guamensis]
MEHILLRAARGGMADEAANVHVELSCLQSSRSLASCCCSEPCRGRRTSQARRRSLCCLPRTHDDMLYVLIYLRIFEVCCMLIDLDCPETERLSARARIALIVAMRSPHRRRGQLKSQELKPTGCSERSTRSLSGESGVSSVLIQPSKRILNLEF